MVSHEPARGQLDLTSRRIGPLAVRLPGGVAYAVVVGADAVGMSTVPEVIVARQGGMRVLGFSGISNKANLDGNTPTTHAEVLQAGALIVPKLEKIVRGVLAEVKR